MMSRMMSTVSACVLCLAHLPWTKEVKYLGIYLVSSKRFKISTEHSRRSFYRAANAIWKNRENCHCLTSIANQLRAYLVIWT